MICLSSTLHGTRTSSTCADAKPWHRGPPPSVTTYHTSWAPSQGTAPVALPTTAPCLASIARRTAAGLLSSASPIARRATSTPARSPPRRRWSFRAARAARSKRRWPSCSLRQPRRLAPPASCGGAGSLLLVEGGLWLGEGWRESHAVTRLVLGPSHLLLLARRGRRKEGERERSREGRTGGSREDGGRGRGRGIGATGSGFMNRKAPPQKTTWGTFPT